MRENVRLYLRRIESALKACLASFAIRDTALNCAAYATCLIEHRAQRNTDLPSVSGETFYGTTVARALEPGHEFLAAPVSEFIESEQPGLVHEPRHLQMKIRRVDCGMAVMLGGGERILRCERTVDRADIEQPLTLAGVVLKNFSERELYVSQTQLILIR